MPGLSTSGLAQLNGNCRLVCRGYFGQLLGQRFRYFRALMYRNNFGRAGLTLRRRIPGRDYGGRALRVNEALDKRRSGGGGGGGGGGAGGRW